MQALIVGGEHAEPSLIEEVLTDRGHRAAWCEDVDDAWDVFRRDKPDLVVFRRLDEGGLELVRRIRGTEHGDAIIVLAVVEPDGDDILQALVDAEIDDCVAETESRAYLDARLMLALRRSEQRIRRRRVEKELASRVQQQALVAHMGVLALSGTSEKELMDHAVCVVADAFGATFCEVLLPHPSDADVLVLQAGVGWEPSSIGQVSFRATPDTQAGYTLQVSEPVVVEEWDRETRFEGGHLLNAQGVVSGVSVVLTAHGEAFGVLGVHTVERHVFHEDDIHFLQAVANVLAGAIERTRAEARLQKTAVSLQEAQRIAHLGSWRWDIQTDEVQWSDELYRIFGLVPGEFPATLEAVLDRIHTDDRDRVRSELEAVAGGTGRFDVEHRIVLPTGETRILHSQGVLECDEEGKAFRMRGTAQDITERNKAEEALRNSEVRTRAILSTTVDGIIIIDRKGIVETFNRAAERIFGLRAEEVIGNNVSMLMPAPYREEHDSYIQNYIETGHRKIIGIGREAVGLRRDGSVFPMELAVSEVELDDGRRLFAGMVRDITERRRLEQEILRISEEERRRIGQDLHDGLGQMLTGIGLITQNLARVLHADNVQAAAEMDEVTELIREADQHARGLARGLVPVDLAATGLTAALERLINNAARLFGIRCTFEHVGTVLIHDNTVATHLYRIAQEAVSNAVKHGRAKHVRVSLASGRGHIRLRIQDDGVGFPDDLDEERRGMGVRIMHYRARVIGATLEIAKGIDGGTTITCTFRRTAASPRSAGELAEA